MKLVTVRELKLSPGTVWRNLNREQNLVLTSNGKPIAVITKVDETDLEETLALLRRLRAQWAASRMREISLRRGLHRLSRSEIEKEIDAARRTLRGKRS